MITYKSKPDAAGYVEAWATINDKPMYFYCKEKDLELRVKALELAPVLSKSAIEAIVLLSKEEDMKMTYEYKRGYEDGVSTASVRVK